jgi:hypothetical protein
MAGRKRRRHRHGGALPAVRLGRHDLPRSGHGDGHGRRRRYDGRQYLVRGRAVVHRDGGHYREAHGDRKAADDAIAVVSKLRSELAAEREQRASSAPEDIARRFHDAYEYLAPQFGYSTRPESRVAWDELPQNLRDLMIAVVRNVLIEQPAADAD